ncbi:hypothetical protein PTSG_09280 [Salpingoeca rosetta]|uniref:Uncharacterized protein n=1 Tax=Salpingoeca rosetta (strain ATCC 50818 / BSB-021) TaxID=946362 RepID=F2UN89_SALR5|nr:uncharacterized protein PTSG_09280 [Salpingoeca rosetta]EGD78588.1 hypothetical protein PTSG_09280 [Salpingoeca rosetta]|eukprot:XP_004989537.1 hypothetical protein PTSG_09280 [Salpingoeca rosetta]
MMMSQPHVCEKCCRDGTFRRSARAQRQFLSRTATDTLKKYALHRHVVKRASAALQRQSSEITRSMAAMTTSVVLSPTVSTQVKGDPHEMMHVPKTGEESAANWINLSSETFAEKLQRLDNIKAEISHIKQRMNAKEHEIGLRRALLRKIEASARMTHVREYRNACITAVHGDEQAAEMQRKRISDATDRIARLKRLCQTYKRLLPALDSLLVVDSNDEQEQGETLREFSSRMTEEFEQAKASDGRPHEHAIMHLIDQSFQDPTPPLAVDRVRVPDDSPHAEAVQSVFGRTAFWCRDGEQQARACVQRARQQRIRRCFELIPVMENSIWSMTLPRSGDVVTPFREAPERVVLTLRLCETLMALVMNALSTTPTASKATKPPYKPAGDGEVPKHRLDTIQGASQQQAEDRVLDVHRSLCERAVVTFLRDGALPSAFPPDVSGSSFLAIILRCCNPEINPNLGAGRPLTDETMEAIFARKPAPRS